MSRLVRLRALLERPLLRDAAQDAAAGILIRFALALMVGLTFMLVTYAGLRAAGVAARGLPAWLGLAVALAIVLRITGDAAFRSAIALLATVAVALLLSWLVVDTQFDSQRYHAAGVEALLRGWNPYADPPITGPTSTWTNHYPKGTWMMAAAVIEATGRYETGKAVNLILAVAAWSVYAAWLLQFGFIRPAALALATLLIANPIVVTQMFSLYVDGALATAVMAFLACAVLALAGGTAWPALATGACLALLLPSFKFTGIFFGGAVLCAVAVIALIDGRHRRAVLPIALLASALLLGTVVLAFNPYVTNWIVAGHPLHPVLGAAAMPILAVQEMPEMQRWPLPIRVLLSIASRSTQASWGPIPLKLPFLVYPREVTTLWVPDLRLGGFGPWFSGGVLLALIAVGRLWGTGLSREGRVLLLLAASLTLMCCVVPGGWWARLVPVLWAAPILAAAAVLHSPRPRVRGHVLAWASLVALAANATAIGAASGAAGVVRSFIVSTQMQRLESQQSPLRVEFGRSVAYRVRFAERGLAVVEVPAETCAGGRHMSFSDTWVCPDSAAGGGTRPSP